MENSSILDIDESIEKDETIEKYEYHEYTPSSGTTNLNNGGELEYLLSLKIYLLILVKVF